MAVIQKTLSQFLTPTQATETYVYVNRIGGIFGILSFIALGVVVVSIIFMVKHMDKSDPGIVYNYTVTLMQSFLIFAFFTVCTGIVFKVNSVLLSQEHGILAKRRKGPKRFFR